MHPAHHVPHVVGQPVDDRVAAAHELQVFGLGGLFSHEEHHEARWHEGHGHDNEDGNHHVCALQAAWGARRRAGTPSPSAAWGRATHTSMGQLLCTGQVTAQGSPHHHHLVPPPQPAGQKPQHSPANCGGELPPFHRTAILPQTQSPDLQVIQGQAGACLVHGVVGDRDACRKAQEETWECESWLRTENLAPSLSGPGSEREDRFLPCSSAGAELPEATKHLEAKPSLTSWQTASSDTLQVQVPGGSTSGGSAPAHALPRSDKVSDPPASSRH